MIPLNEWANGYCLNKFSAICWWEHVTFWWDDNVRFVLGQHAKLDIYSANSLKQHSASRHVISLRDILMIPSQPVLVLAP